MRITRRRLFQSGGLAAAGIVGGTPAGSEPASAPSPEVYTRLGVRQELGQPGDGVLRRGPDATQGISGGPSHCG